jgi:hypothetical protein
MTSLKAYGATKADDQDLVLYLSGDTPTETDRLAEVAVKKFDPSVTVERVHDYMEISTPRLLSGRSFYRGLASIMAFIEYEKLHRTR